MLTDPLDIEATRIIVWRVRPLMVIFMLFIIALGLWALVGNIATTTEGLGLLAQNPNTSGARIVIASPIDGEVVDLLVARGDVVTVGQVVAKIAFKDDAGSIIEVTSLYAGTVTRVAVRREDEIRANAMLYALENQSLIQADTPAPLEAVIYLSYGDVLPVQIGMEALVIPQGVEPSRYGLLRGRVRAVAQFPATDAFARAVAPQEPVVAVYITLDTDSDGRYLWTIHHDTPFDLRSGMRLLGRVVIRNERPLDRLIRSLNTP